jgi:2-C-methyl-D-erythritol 4-phosphate cytidylyltransferase
MATRVRDGASAVPALPVVDTIKESDTEGHVARTLDRSRLWRAQTPQGFPRAVIERAHREARAANVEATDDAALCERLGVPVELVPGSERCMKVTDEGDFERIEALFAAR